MNYIKHMNKAMQLFFLDDRLLTSHIALYLALFKSWNENRFQNPVSIIRTEIMKSAKINSLSTYTKCLRQLHEWNYLEYIPSHNPTLGTRVNLFDFCTTDCNSNCTTECTTDCTTTPLKTVQLPYINNINNKHSKGETSPELKDVLIFFEEKKFPTIEGEKFFNYFQSNGWKVGGKTPMQDWKAAAQNWMLNSSKFNKHEKNSKPGNLRTGNDKDYAEPL